MNNGLIHIHDIHEYSRIHLYSYMLTSQLRWFSDEN
jgi:hypothetical protein